MPRAAKGTATGRHARPHNVARRGRRRWRIVPLARSLQALWSDARWHGLPPWMLARLFGQRFAARFIRVVGALPIIPDGGERWQPIDAAAARDADWHFVVAARAGCPCPPWEVPGVECGEKGFSLFVPTARGARTVRAHSALNGTEVVDLVAFTPGWPGSPLRPFLGHALALGDALGEEMNRDEDAAGPVPIARDLWAWFRGAARGAVLPLGEDAERGHYLRSIPCGLRAADVAHGRALRRLMRIRPPTPEPDIFVLDDGGGDAGDSASDPEEVA